jgi:hypothetical protein
MLRELQCLIAFLSSHKADGRLKRRSRAANARQARSYHSAYESELIRYLQIKLIKRTSPIRTAACQRV